MKAFKPKKKRTPDQNRRYKLHQKIKIQFELYAKKKLIVIPYDYNLRNKFVIELRDKFRYNIQYSIVSPNNLEVNQ
jgi:hypothetical protein